MSTSKKQKDEISIHVKEIRRRDDRARLREKKTQQRIKNRILYGEVNGIRNTNI